MCSRLQPYVIGVPGRALLLLGCGSRVRSELGRACALVVLEGTPVAAGAVAVCATVSTLWVAAWVHRAAAWGQGMAWQWAHMEASSSLTSTSALERALACRMACRSALMRAFSAFSALYDDGMMRYSTSTWEGGALITVGILTVAVLTNCGHTYCGCTYCGYAYSGYTYYCALMASFSLAADSAGRDRLRRGM
jgi:hypothetical protein